jgi:predicted RNA-binding protein Jag
MALVEFRGKDTEEAINNAASALSVRPEHLDFTILSTGSRGFLGLGSQKARILVDTQKSQDHYLEAETLTEGRLSPLKQDLVASATKSKSLEGEALAKSPSQGAKLSTNTVDVSLSPGLITEHGSVSFELAAKEEATKNLSLGELEGEGLTSTEKEGAKEEYQDPLSSIQEEVRVIPALFEEWKAEGFSASDFQALPNLVFAKLPVILPKPLTQPVIPEEGKGGKNQELAKLAGETLKDLLKLMGFTAKVSQRCYRDRVILEIDSHENALIIGRRGVGLDALELIVVKICLKDEDNFNSVKLIVDAEDYRARRHVSIIQKTFQLANQALATRKIQSLPQLTSFERKLAKSSVEHIKGIVIKTQGGGALRNIQLHPQLKD